MKTLTRPTVHDVAREAGVSLATVDRVLNERPGVRPATIARVQHAIETLGYVRDVGAANLARQRDYRFAFVLPEPVNAFLSLAHDAVGEAQQRGAIERTKIEIHPAPVHDGHAVAKTLNALDAGALDGLAIMASETPQVRDALKRFVAEGVAIAAVVRDLPSTDRDYFVGVDNLAAGRTAGDLMGRFVGERPGKIVVLAGSMMARDHVERRLGFDQVMRDRYPHLEPMASIETWDDAEMVEALLPKALAAHDDIRGVYALGGGNSGLIAVLKARRLGGDAADAGPRPQVIAHELTGPTRAALIDGDIDAIITQDLRHIVRSAVRSLRASSDNRDVVESQERIRIEVIMRENLS